MILTTTLASLLCLSSVAVALPNHPGKGHEAPFFFKGFDLSSVKILEDGGAIFKDTARGNATKPVEVSPECLSMAWIDG